MSALPSYTIHRARTQPSLTGQWDEAAWQAAETIEVRHFHARSSDHRPRTRVRVLAAPAGLHAIFAVEDRYVLSVTTELHGMVCRDSCVEFFVQPKPDRGYFNFELNCGGCLHVSCIEDPTRVPGGFKRYAFVPPALAQTVRIYHSLPRTVTPEIAAPQNWTIEVFIPYALFTPFVGAVAPQPGDTWRGNFYKCGDATSHPHWAMWAPMGADLNFHQPQYFAPLRFA
jgi:hypothetical protein